MKRMPTILAVPADTHSGSPLGLLPPGQWALEKGGYHDPGETEKIITRLWIECWERVAELRKDKRLIVVHDGDAVEGLHHDSPEPWTMNIDEHERAHTTAMELALTIADYGHEDDLIYYVKGTKAHVGAGGSSEERIAREWGGRGGRARIQPSSDDANDGAYLWDHLRIDVNGKLFDIAHHGAGLSKLPWSETNPLRNKLAAIYWRCIEEKRRIPDYWIRAHMHRAARDVYMRRATTIHGYVCPAFQSKTEYGNIVAADFLAHLGMLIFEITADGQVIDHSIVKEYNPDPIEEV